MILISAAPSGFIPRALGEERQEKWMEEKESKLLQAEQYANRILKIKPVTPRRAESQKRWNLFGKFGYEYDDNIVLASDKKEFRRNSRDTDAGRYRISSGLSYEFLRKGKNRAGISYHFSQFLHDDSLNESNFQNHVVSIYGARRFTAWNKPSEAGVRYTFSHGLLDRHTFSSSHFWNGFWSTEWYKNWVLTLYENIGTMNFRNKGFNKDISSRDGFYQETGIFQTWLFDKRQRSISLGYEFGLEETEGNNFDVISNGLRAVLKTPLIERVEFSTFFYFRADYHRHFTVRPKRLDLRYQYEFRLSRPIGKIWKTSLFYRRTDVNNLHDGVQGQFNYDRNIYGFELSFYY